MILHVFGCTCFVQDLSPRLDKLSPKSIKCVFIGYFRTRKEYRCYNPSTRKYLESTDVTFFESVPYFSPQVPITISETVPPSPTMSLPTPASTVSSPVPLVETQDPPATKPVRNFRYATLITQKFLPPNQFRLSPLQQMILLRHQHLPLILIFSLPFGKINSLALIILF